MEKRKEPLLLLREYQNVQEEELKKELSDYIQKKKDIGEHILMISKKYGKMKLYHD